MFNNLICPICFQTLLSIENSFKCENNHNFDLSKEGYLNLLLVNQKTSNDPGDSIGMVIARNEFLNKGFYQTLSNEINTQVKKIFPKEIAILDCGCGEGYYLANLIKALDNNSTGIGLDLSKSAVQMAAKNYKNIDFIIGNLSTKLPFRDNSFDLLLNIFAPKNIEEYSRILKPNGILIIIFPNKDHLLELRNSLDVNLDYQNKPEEIVNNFSTLFTLIDKKNVKGELNLNTEDAGLLIKMTPIYWQIDHQKLGQIKNIQTSYDFNIYIFEKK